MLKDFTVIYDGEEYPVTGALDAQDAATMASDRIYSDTAGEGFDCRHGKPTRVTVRDGAGETTAWDVTVEFVPSFYAHRVSADEREGGR